MKRPILATVVTKAKTMQFAYLAGLAFVGNDDGGPEFVGSGRQWQDFKELQAKDDRGEFYQRYPWQPVSF